MWVFCGGMKRSGSTLQFQIAAHLVEWAEVGRRVEFVPPAQFPVVRDKYEGEYGKLVFKSHFCTPEIKAEFAAGRAMGFYVYRDLRDVIVSLMHKNSCSLQSLLVRNVPEECVREYENWTTLPGMLVMKYEEMVTDPVSSVRRMAAHLDIDISDKDCWDIAERHSIAAQRKRMESLRSGLAETGKTVGYNPESLLHHNHIRSGEVGLWRRELARSDVVLIEQRVGDFLKHNGYALMTDEKYLSKDSVRLFSQKGEDSLLWEFFNYRSSGFFVDVGAFDGVHLSNSYSFELAGWSGICVEANPEYFQLCAKARPNSKCVNAACVGDPSMRQITFKSEPIGLLSGVSVDADDVAQRYERRGLHFEGFKEITVPAVTLNELLERFLPEGGVIDFISIDVEGTEIEVLKGLDLDRFQVSVLVIEANNDKARQELESYLKPTGYVVARILGPNLIFTHPGEESDRMKAVSIDCVIEQNLHPFGENYTLKDCLHDRVVRELDPEPKASTKYAESFLRRFLNWIFRRGSR